MRNSFSSVTTGGVLAVLGALVLGFPAQAQTAQTTDLVAQGKEIFETGVAGLPCTACHGEDQTALVGPVIEGGTVQMVHTALASVDAMSSLSLSLPQMVAVSAYLQSLTPASTSMPMTALEEEGKALYESSDGKIGCADCHGHDQTALVAPDLTGTTVAEVHAVVGQIEEMEGLTLTLPQMVAVAAYLDYVASK